MPGLVYGRVVQDQKDSGDYQTNLEADKKTKSRNAPKFSFGSSSRFGAMGPDTGSALKSGGITRRKVPALVGASSSIGKQVTSGMRSYGACSFASSQRACNVAKKNPRPKEIDLQLPSGMGKQVDSKLPSSRAVRFFEGGARLFPMLKPNDPREVKPPMAETAAQSRGDSGLGLGSHVSSFGKVIDSAVTTQPRAAFGKSARGLTYAESRVNPDKFELYDLTGATFKQSQFESGGSAWMGAQPKDKAGNPVQPRAVNKHNGVPGPGKYQPQAMKGPPAYNMGAMPDKGAVVTSASARRPYAHCAF